MATDNEKLLKLYELSINEEHYFLDAHQNRITFYTGIISALVGGTVAGFILSSDWHHLAFLSLGPILIFVVSSIGKVGSSRWYLSFLETVTVRAKIEQELGLTKERPASAERTDAYWQSEPIIPHRHIASRQAHGSSDDFVKESISKGYHLWAIRLFLVFQVLSALMFVGIWALAICVLCGWACIAT